MSDRQTPKGADVSALSFEDALAELEQIVRGLESGQQKLEDAITAYERGAALRRHCEAKLAEAEARVAAIVEHADGYADDAGNGVARISRGDGKTRSTLIILADPSRSIAGGPRSRRQPRARPGPDTRGQGVQRRAPDHQGRRRTRPRCRAGGSWPGPSWVSRGGLKLDHALKQFGLSPQGRICLDVGASTGGFTDVLLAHGAAKVHAVDVGHGQLAWKLRTDPRVVVHERTNARYVTHDMAQIRSRLWSVTQASSASASCCRRRWRSARTAPGRWR